MACIPVGVSAEEAVYGIDQSTELTSDTMPRGNTGLSISNVIHHSFEEATERPLILSNPPNIGTETLFDPKNNLYYRVTRVGDRIVGRPRYITFEEFQEYDMDKSLRRFWETRARGTQMERGDGVFPEIYVGGEIFDRIFGGRTIDIRPTGSADLIFGVLSNRRDDPAINQRDQRVSNFDFQQRVQLAVQARIGEKINIESNFNTEATFDFENRMKLEYRGTEDEILQLIEAGDVSLPLPGTLITGNMGLFGFKTQLKFGNTTVTSVFSQQRTESKTIEAQGGAQTTKFEFRADDYEENRHFFLAHYFRDNYDESMSTLPVIGSNVIIDKIEVWVTNIGPATQNNRNIVAFADLGESLPHRQDIGGGGAVGPPHNQANRLLERINVPAIRAVSQVNSYLMSQGFNAGIDYENIENARLLNPNEFTFNSRLGFISLNQTLNPDQVLAVAFSYTIIGDTATYQVGEFSNQIDAPNSLIVKLLKSTSVNTRIPMWDLMMKNVYNIGAFQINSDDFILNILYDDPVIGVPVGFLREGPEGTVNGVPLIRVMGLDRLNTQHDPIPDGLFDFVDNATTQGGTIQASNGRIFFPVVEPFGEHLREMLQDPALGDKYAFDSLYTTTKFRAQQFPERNRFIIEGRFKSAAGAEIPLNALNVPQGSVVVTAGGIPLTENVDYTVDYTLGRVRIINEAILNAGTPIRISLESASLFNIQTRTLLGTYIEHRFNDNLSIGGTIMRLSERPLTQKVNFGEEPIANSIWGLNATYQTQSLFLTRLIDRLPFYSTITPSRFTFVGEFANLVPGHSRLIGRAGTAYIDDFEGSKSSMDLRSMHSWTLASTPQHQTQPGMFPEGAPNTGLAFRYNSAKLAWYFIDRLFSDTRSTLIPSHLRRDLEQLSNHYVREVRENEIWPNKEFAFAGQPPVIQVLNLVFNPNQRGMYNYNVRPGPFGRGMAADGTLNDPATRWGGIQRSMLNPDFESANIEYIEFWLLDPFIYSPEHRGGYLYFNLGNISEDVLRDGRKGFENGLPVSDVVENVDTTIWGRVPNIQAIVHSFDNNPQARRFQDVGADGLGNDDEREFFSDGFLNEIAALHGTASEAYRLAYDDPSADDFQFYRGSELDQRQASILERYADFNGMDGNSPTAEMSPEPFPVQGTITPNTEDINRDGTLNEAESYFQYRVSLRPEDMVIGQNYITDIVEARVTLKNGETDVVNWYQFKIPLRDPDRQVINGIQDFKSIRFMRMFLKGWEEPVILRFATLELVRGNWRTFDRSLFAPGEYLLSDNSDTKFEVFTVNIEENGTRFPVPYVLPPGIERETDIGTTTMQRRNEQSLSLRVTNLKDGDARAIYKTTDLDLRQYRRIRMFTHAEAIGNKDGLNDNDLTVFIRLGSDFTNNYYEYEIPLKVTPWGSGPVREIVWPRENEFDINIESLTNLKLTRNTLARDASSGVSLNTPYVEYNGSARLTVIGTPTLSNVRVIMIGVRNNRRTIFTPDDDGLSKSGEIWINELRLYEFVDQGGWAATGRINTQLADLGSLTVAGFTSTPGFGSLEQDVSTRSMETVKSYDIASNLELGKFFPEDFRLRIPFHFSFSESFTDPQYNPLNPDILFYRDLQSFQSPQERDSVINISRDYVRRKSINFTNVGKSLSPEMTGPSRLWAIENFDLTYSFTELYARNIDVEFDRQRAWRGILGYNWQNDPQPVTPFANWEFLRGNHFRLLRDFNFFYMPRLVSIRNIIDRSYSEFLMRNKSRYQIILEPSYVKTFSWDRLYDIRFDLTRSLRIEFSAINNARIDEPPGRINRNDEDFSFKRDSILRSFRNFGRTTFYNHRINVTYSIPVNKIPMLDWITANAGYAANFDWQAAPLAATQFGNTIENSNSKRLNINANLVNLYNKSNYLRRINQRDMARPGQRGQPQPPQPRAPAQEQQENQPDNLQNLSEGFLRLLMGVRNISVNFTESNGTRLPGFTRTPQLIGMDWDFNAPGYGAPGIGFILGSQDDIRDKAIRGGWITKNPRLNNAFIRNHTQNLSARALFEPIPRMRIELSALRNYARTYSEFFKADTLGQFNSFSPMTSGSFSISFLPIRTAFKRNHRNFGSEVYEDFKRYRFIIAQRLAKNNPNWSGLYDVPINEFDTVPRTGFPLGYGPTSQDVLISAFKAAYAGWDPSTSGTNPFPRIPMPNWTLTYDGLSRIEPLRRVIQTITIAHGYRSTFTIGAFRSIINYREQNGYPSAIDNASNFIPRYEIGQVLINEQFTPLIGLDITWVNGLMTRVEYRSSRNIGLSFANNQVTDVKTREIIVGSGYRIRNLAFSFTQGGNTQQLQSDLVLRLDISFRRNQTVLRRITEGIDVISAGQDNVSFNFSADYQISRRVNLRFFFDRSVINPFLSNQFLTANSHGGFSFRFILM